MGAAQPEPSCPDRGTIKADPAANRDKVDEREPSWSGEELALIEPEAWIRDVCFVARPRYVPPLTKGGQGGLTTHGRYLGPIRQFRAGQPSGNCAPGRGYAGIPPLPPLLKGGTTRNGIGMKTKLTQRQLFTGLEPS